MKHIRRTGQVFLRAGRSRASCKGDCPDAGAVGPKRAPAGMTVKSKAFEQEIHRLHELIDGCGAEVTWNDHIPDPDNARQPRQIDITIKREGALAIVECRIHRNRQGVKWIEELIGRRASLRAAAAIAVSASGFTRGAINKAKSFGIFLRDLKELTPREIESWGCQIKMTVYYYQFANLELSLLFEPHSIAKLDSNRLAAELQAFPGRQSLFNAATNQLDELKLLTDEERRRNSAEFRVKGEFQNFSLCGEPVLGVELTGSARLLEMEISLPSVLAYGEPGQDPGNRAVVRQKATSGNTGFIVHEGYRIATIVDLSSIDLPLNCQFRYVRTTASKTMDVDSFEILGVDRLCMSGGPMSVNIEAVAN
jgi:hypothetical protein